MSRLHFFIKFILSKGNLKKINWNMFLPVIGIIIGTVTVSLTLAVMEGMEYSLYSRLKNIAYPAKIVNVKQNNIAEVSAYFRKINIKSTPGIEEKLLLINKQDFRLINILAFDDFIDFKKNILSPYLYDENATDKKSGIYIGRTLASRLDVKIGDTLEIAAPQSVNLFTGLPRHNSVIVSGIFNLEILDYDQKYIFSDINTLGNLFPESKNNIYINRIMAAEEINYFTNAFPHLEYKTWMDKHHTFIAAMRLEKITYSLFGFLIIGISGFTLLSMMSLTVMQKIPQIGILKSMGFGQRRIGSIFIFQALFTGLISSSIGIALCKILIKTDEKYHIVKNVFPEAAFFEFPLILQEYHIPLIISISTLLLMSAGVYPALKASGMDVVKSVEYR